MDTVQLYERDTRRITKQGTAIEMQPEMARDLLDAIVDDHAILGTFKVTLKAAIDNAAGAENGVPEYIVLKIAR